LYRTAAIPPSLDRFQIPAKFALVKTLTISEAAKGLATCVDRVYRKGESFELTKNGVARARLVPANGMKCTTHELADDLAKSNPLSYKDRRAWGAGLRQGRKRLKPLKNPWA
jgi:antitoxin (DNA-binding transcriptional repressor) of toxin-antitoxin stability system